MPTFIPTLSSTGWIGTIAEKGDYALSCFITSEYSQSVLFAGQIASLQYLVKTYAGDEQKLQINTQEALDRYMRHYLGENIDVRVQVNAIDPDRPSRLAIRFNCTVRENGIEYQLGKEVEMLDGKLIKIASINNG